MATLIPASEKKQQLDSKKTPTEKCKEWLAQCIREATAIPFNIDPLRCADGTSEADVEVIAAWLKSAGYSMAIKYHPTSNGENVMDEVIVNSYDDRGWRPPYAIQYHGAEYTSRIVTKSYV